MHFRPNYKILLFILPLFLAQNSFCQKQKPISIIFDTDMGPDYDDVGAIAMLHALADKGECSILATMASDKHQYVASVLDLLNTYFGRPDLPIGVVRGEAAEIPSIQKWDSIIVNHYPHDIKNNAEASDALSLYRKILASQPDKSVTIVTVGFFTNMANLLKSPPDQYSKLNGLALVTKKVKKLVSMAACFDHRMGDFKEFNVKIDAPASKIVFDQWPGPILFSGFEIGANLFTGLPITKNEKIQRSPVKDIFSMCIPMDPKDINGRMSWDETAVLIAVRRTQKYFNIKQGKIISKIDGSNSWDYSLKRDHYLIPKMSKSNMENILNNLIMHVPSTK